MLLETLIALVFVFIQPTIHHYIGDLDECTLTKVCNHTWVPICGHNEADSNYRLFLDDCDLHEYNCDYNTTYKEVDAKVCSQKCTKKDHPLPSSTTPTPVSTTQTPSTIEVSTIVTTEGVTETVKTDTPTIFVEPTTIETTTKEPETTTNATETTTIETDTTTKLEEKSTQEENIDENTIPLEPTPGTTSSAPPETTRTSLATPTANFTCNPKHCTLPSTWETTAVGETRDFVQILRERYGDRVKFLRHTTHFPMKPNMYFRRSDFFLPGSHSDRRRPSAILK